MKSKFNEDLNDEQKLAIFLDSNYYNNTDKFSSRFSIKRENDLNLQYRGVDLIIYDTKNENKKYYIDEKAQLHYKNKSLPTFAFELSYIKDNQLKEGWLFDKSKITDKYFVITSVEEKNNEILSCRLVSVDREKLISFLYEKRLTREKLFEYDRDFRLNGKFKKQFIKELNSKEGSLNYTSHLSEKPINIVLYLDFLIKNKIGKEIFPSQI